MTEAEWNSAPIPDLLLYTLDIHRARYGAEPENSVMLQPPRSALRVDLGRKHMLLAYGLLRRYWQNLGSNIKHAVDTLEALEDTPDKQLDAPLDDFAYVMDLFIAHQDATEDETSAAIWVVSGWWPEVKTACADKHFPESWRPFFHDVFGDFFRSVSLNPVWLTPTVKALASTIYDERAFDRMPILGDALEEAGCANADILSHCSQPGEHIKGCWVVDLILGKE